MKVIIAAHGHPTLHKGGGEVAAYALHRMLRARGHHSVFVGWGGASESANGGSLTQIGEDDYLLFTETEHFRFSSVSSHLPEAFCVLLDAYQPDAVHLHHYLHIGIEAASMIKKMRPLTRVIMTLHEYLSLCANNGQLFTKTKEICLGYTPDRCATKCFPQVKPSAFFMREMAVKSALSFVDKFIAPSRFLADQYVAWGLPAARISVTENPLSLAALGPFAPVKRALKSTDPIRLGFFGQINFYKGLDIVVQAVVLANRNGRSVLLGIHGNYSDVTGREYSQELREAVDASPELFTYHGPYSQPDVFDLMTSYHFVVMGSRWYENSPVVIQEAIHAGVPVIVPGHGGMAEKAVGAGLTYRPGSAESLASLLTRLTARSYAEIRQLVTLRGESQSASCTDSFEQIIKHYAARVEIGSATETLRPDGSDIQLEIE